MVSCSFCVALSRFSVTLTQETQRSFGRRATLQGHFRHLGLVPLRNRELPLPRRAILRRSLPSWRTKSQRQLLLPAISWYVTRQQSIASDLTLTLVTAAPFLLALYLIWRVYSWFARPEHRPLYVKIKDIDIYSGMRQGQMDMISGPNVSENQRRESVAELAEDNSKGGVAGHLKAIVRSVF